MNVPQPQKKNNLAALDRATVELPDWIAHGSPLRVVALLIFLLAAALMLPWHETLRVPMTIQLGSQPRSVTTPQAGVLHAITVQSGDAVRAGDVMAELGPSGEMAQIRQLSTILPQVRAALQSGQSPVALPEVTIGGNVQTTASRLAGALNALAVTQGFPVEQRDAAILQSTIAGIESGAGRLQDDIRSADELVVVAEEQLRIKTELAERGWVSRQALAEARAIVIERQIAARQARARVNEDRTSLRGLRLQLERSQLEQGRTATQLRETAIQAAADAAGAVSRWRSTHLVLAPMAGIVQFPEDRVAGQRVSEGQEFAVVVPRNKGLAAVGLVPPAARGDVRPGAEVRMEIAGFPAATNGYLVGEVSSTASVAMNGGYQVIMTVPNGARSSTGVIIPLRNRSAATGHITVSQGRIGSILFGGLLERLRREA